jgi:hypothetical protein
MKAKLSPGHPSKNEKNRSYSGAFLMAFVLRED